MTNLAWKREQPHEKQRDGHGDELETTTKTSQLIQLPEEILSEVLTWLDRPLYNEKLERREYLSQESFSMPALPSRGSARDVANLRTLCKKLAEVGAVHQFAKITTRFSQQGLDRLEEFCNWPHLAKHVMKFSYLVRNFYVQGPDRVDGMPPDLETDIGIVHINALEAKLREQDRILNSEQDIRVLCKALAAFGKLQHIQILRVQDQEDDLLLQRLRQHNELSRFFDLGWAQACAHTTSTIGKAIMISKSPCSRFSSPMLSPQSAQVLAAPLSKYMPLASKLTSLEIHFDDGFDLNENILAISRAFYSIFTTASNMQAIHIGFPSHRPINLRLEDIFHNVTWKSLKAFGIQSWKLDAEEIIEFTSRHRGRLRGLRLRDVLLNEGTLWTDVLRFLRDEMPCLDWVSLRRIGYAAHFDEQSALAGAEIPDDHPGMGSDSGTDEGTDESSTLLDRPMTNVMEYDSDDNSLESIDILEGDFYDNEDDDNDEGGPHAHEMEFPQMRTMESTVALNCSCRSPGLYPHSSSSLGDDGIFISNNLRKMWEKWILHRCPLHGTCQPHKNDEEH